MPYTSLNGRQVSYGDSGTGVPVVLIHGSFSTSSAWKRIVANLDANRARALTPDLPGWGDSYPAPEDCSDLGDYHAAAVEVAVKEAAVDPIHLVAHSYGAVVALNDHHCRTDRYSFAHLVRTTPAGAACTNRRSGSLR